MKEMKISKFCSYVFASSEDKDEYDNLIRADQQVKDYKRIGEWLLRKPHCYVFNENWEFYDIKTDELDRLKQGLNPE